MFLKRTLFSVSARGILITTRKQTSLYLRCRVLERLLQTILPTNQPALYPTTWLLQLEGIMQRTLGSTHEFVLVNDIQVVILSNNSNIINFSCFVTQHFRRMIIEFLICKSPLEKSVQLSHFRINITVTGSLEAMTKHWRRIQGVANAQQKSFYTDVVSLTRNFEQLFYSFRQYNNLANGGHFLVPRMMRMNDNTDAKLFIGTCQ
jgi:hypothetical protein